MHQPKYKICRRLGARVFGKCENPKLVLSTKTRIRQKKMKRPKTLSEFGLQMLEKQKVRYTYNLRERQFSNYVHSALDKKGSNPIEKLYQSLESRLDNTVFKLGLAKTRGAARQLVSHGHITVNDKKATIPSYQVREGDLIGIKKNSREKAIFSELGEKLKEHECPAWLTLDTKAQEGKVKSAPVFGDYSEAAFNLTSVIEFYGR